jgi:hypothetical protein
MPEKTPVCCPKFSCQKKFTSDSWHHKRIKLHHPEHLHVGRQKNFTSCRAPENLEPAHRRQFNTHKDSVEELDLFPDLEHVENIADLASQPLQPLPWMELYPGSGALLIVYIPQPWERDAQG